VSREEVGGGVNLAADLQLLLKPGGRCACVCVCVCVRVRGGKGRRGGGGSEDKRKNVRLLGR
jgi:hypothetical protein